MKGICALLSVVLILAGFWLGRVETPVQPVTAEEGSLYVGDYSAHSLPSKAKQFGRSHMYADEVLSARLSLDGQLTTLADVLSDGEYEKIYLSLIMEDGQEEDYWAVLSLVRQTQPQASVYLVGPQKSEFLKKISDGRDIFYIETL